MRVVVLGSGGFLGRGVVEALKANHEVYMVGRNVTENDHLFNLDLQNKGSIRRVLDLVRPDAVVNCAGIVGGPDSNLNVVFTKNLLEVIVALQLDLRRIIITGSAAEYGRIEPEDLPVAETAPLRADAGYGLSKAHEEETAFLIGQQHDLPVVVVRLFNPVGPGMGPKFLLSSLCRQLAAIRAGEITSIEVSRLDSERDYVHISDVGSAYAALLDGEPRYNVYNVGSGKSTATSQLIEYLVRVSNMGHPEVRQTQADKEALVASQADITRLHSELGWGPRVSIEDAIRSVVNVTE
jgi:nucleoside-diphosphate-sugar epimerase